MTYFTYSNIHHVRLTSITADLTKLSQHPQNVSVDCQNYTSLAGTVTVFPGQGSNIKPGPEVQWHYY
jgi:hypothetical protein